MYNKKTGRYEYKYRGRIVSRQRIYQIKNREKDAARRAVRKAIEGGRLKREPCRKCGKKETQAHHEDYTKRLSVVWLCKRHNDELHLSKKMEAEIVRNRAIL